MPIDQNHRALLRAVDSLTTQVRRIADTLETPVADDADGAQTTGVYAPNLSNRPIRTITSWLPACPSGRHPAHALQTCEEVDAFTAFVQDRVQQQSVAEWKTTGDDTPVTRGAEKQRTIRRQQFRILLNQLNDGTTPLTTAQVQALTAYVADEIVECNMETQEADRLDVELARIRRALDPDDETYIRETVDDQLAMTAKVAELEATIGRVREVQAWLTRNYPGLMEPASRLFLALSPNGKEG